MLGDFTPSRRRYRISECWRWRLPDAYDPEQIISGALADAAEFSLLCGLRAHAIILAEAVLTRVADIFDPPQLILLARSLGVIGSAHVEDGRYGDALPLLDAIVARFQGSQDPALRRQVALALYNKSLALDALGLEDESLAVHADMVARFGEDALAVLERPATHFAAATEPQVREHLAVALYSRARILIALTRLDDAVITLTELIAGFQEDDDSDILMIVSEARADSEQIINRSSG